MQTSGRSGRQPSPKPDHPPERQDDSQQNHRGEQGRLARDLQKRGHNEEDQRPKPEKADEDVEVLPGADFPEISVGGARVHYLTAPAVSPATICRWKISTMMTRGIVTIVAAAMMDVYGSSCGNDPVNPAIATVTVWVCSLVN